MVLINKDIPGSLHQVNTRTGFGRLMVWYDYRAYQPKLKLIHKLEKICTETKSGQLKKKMTFLSG